MKASLYTPEFWLTVIPIVAPWIVILSLVLLVALGRADLADLQWYILSLGIGGSIGGGFASGKYSESRAKVDSR